MIKSSLSRSMEGKTDIVWKISCDEIFSRIYIRIDKILTFPRALKKINFKGHCWDEEPFGPQFPAGSSSENKACLKKIWSELRIDLANCKFQEVIANCKFHGIAECKFQEIADCKFHRIANSKSQEIAIEIAMGG